MLKALSILLVIVAFAECLPTATQQDRDVLALLSQMNGEGTKTIKVGSTMNKVICPTEILDLNTCNETMSKTIVPMEIQIAQNFERLIAELTHCEDMESVDEEDDEDIYKAKLLAVIQKMQTENRPLPIKLASVPTPTKLQCTNGNRLHIVDAVLSNVEEKCTPLPNQEQPEHDEQKCHETTLASQLVIQKCENQESCLLSVDLDFARVCPCATQKYLDITYSCVAANDDEYDEEDDDEDEDDETDMTTTTTTTSTTTTADEGDDETTTKMSHKKKNKKSSRAKRQAFIGDYYGYDYYPDYYYGPGIYDYYGYDYPAYYYGPGLYDYYGYGYGYDYLPIYDYLY